MTVKEKNSKEYYKNPHYCKQCGKLIDYEHRKNIFCCSSCAASYNNMRRSPRSEESRKKISESLKKYHNGESDSFYGEHICLNCGKKIIHNYSNRKFCSSKCCGEYLSKQKTERWLQHPEEFSGEQGYPFISRYLRLLHNNCCQRCGWHELNQFTGNVPLQVHHIDGDCTNNKLENLQLLCPNCHSLTETFGARNVGNSKRYKLKQWHKETQSA